MSNLCVRIMFECYCVHDYFIVSNLSSPFALLPFCRFWLRVHLLLISPKIKVMDHNPCALQFFSPVLWSWAKQPCGSCSTRCNIFKALHQKGNSIGHHRVKLVNLLWCYSIHQTKLRVLWHEGLQGPTNPPGGGVMSPCRTLPRLGVPF